MNAKNLALAAALLAAGCLSSPLLFADGKSVTPKEIQWGANPSLPKYVQSAILQGDPATGAFVTRVKMSKGGKIMPHSHVTENVVTVLSGTAWYAEGDTFDEKKLKAYPAGSFIVETPKVAHYMMAKGPLEFQVSVPGKTTFDYVNPKDDPSKQK